jgi:hypothetical protein
LREVREMCRHEWEEIEDTTRCFGHCVNPRDCNPASHGGITVKERCTKCGMVRFANKNCGNREYTKAFREEGHD